jgi:5-methyltetrahydropteroyltriglutamate--homocysteine methyltransferase
MKRSGEKILTTHVGSLPRRAALVQAIRDRDNGSEQDGSLSTAISSEVTDLVAKQVDAGVDVVSDGEASRGSFVTYVARRLSGFSGRGGDLPELADLSDYPAYAPRVVADRALTELSVPVCTGAVSYHGEAELGRDLENLRSALADKSVEEAFVTAASPGLIATFLRNAHYPDHEAYVRALADAMRTEYHMIHDAGFLLQLDCPDLTIGHHTSFSNASLREYREVVELHVAALNHAVAGIPPGRLRMHVCWGNYEGPHNRDLPLQDIIDIVLKARPGGLAFAAANPRHEHEWQIWERVSLPEGKVLIPGVIDTTTNFVEHPELVAERILRFTRLAGVNHVIAGTDCGFSPFAGWSAVDATVVWAKLNSLRAGADLAASHSAPIRARPGRHPN